MAIVESIFDIAYLSIVLSLGIRLLLEKSKEAKLFGVMAIILGLGDSFHLLPRVISHLSYGGFAANASALSWGKFITSITMTIFYVLFYYYYRSQSQDDSTLKRNIIYALALVRIGLTVLPQNNWGTMSENYMFGIYRNIPFALMGALLIYWSYKERAKPGLKNMSLYILLSFAFYAPVVLWADKYPMIGALMMPKTMAYLIIVVLGYRHFITGFEKKNILGLSYTSLIMGLIGGVFYREFTKFYGYQAENHLSKLHVHVLVLGFLLMLILYMISKEYDVKSMVSLKKPIYVFMSGFTFTIVNMTLLGIYEVVSEGKDIVSKPALEGISGLGHIVLAIGLVQIALKVFQHETVSGFKQTEA